MSDTQRDREERQHVIEVLKSWDGYFIGYTSDEVQEALRYAIASIETDLKYDLLYEETIEQSDKQADKPTTKNDLADDFIEYAKKTFGVELIFKKSDNPDTYEKLFGTTKDDLAVDWESYKDVDGNCLDDLILEVLQNNFDCGNTYGYKVADEIIGLLPSVSPQEPKTGKWISTETKGVRYAFWCRYKCSLCGGLSDHTNFCPNCGAKMVEPQESEE